MSNKENKGIYLHSMSSPVLMQNRAVTYTIETLVSLYIAAENAVEYYKGLKGKLKI